MGSFLSSLLLTAVVLPNSTFPVQWFLFGRSPMFPTTGALPRQKCRAYIMQQPSRLCLSQPKPSNSSHPSVPRSRDLCPTRWPWGVFQTPELMQRDMHGSKYASSYHMSYYSGWYLSCLAKAFSAGGVEMLKPTWAINGNVSVGGWGNIME